MNLARTHIICQEILIAVIQQPSVKQICFIHAAQTIFCWIVKTYWSASMATLRVPSVDSIWTIIATVTKNWHKVDTNVIKLCNTSYTTQVSSTLYEKNIFKALLDNWQNIKQWEFIASYHTSKYHAHAGNNKICTSYLTIKWLERPSTQIKQEPDQKEFQITAHKCRPQR